MIVVQLHCKELSVARSPTTRDATPAGWTASGGAAGPEAGAAGGNSAGGPVKAPVAGEGELLDRPLVRTMLPVSIWRLSRSMSARLQGS